MEITLVYMAGGMSSRFGGKAKQFSKIGPKGETLIEYSLSQALQAPFSEIVFIVGEKTESLFKKKIGNKYKKIPVRYVKQTYNKKTRDKPWGTADALSLLSLKKPFVLCNSDDIYGSDSFKKLYNHLQEHNTQATVGYTITEVVPKKGAVNRGIIKHKGNVKEIIETFNITKKSIINKKDLCNMNIFGFTPDIIPIMKKRVQAFKKTKSRTAECLLPLELSELIKSKQIVMKLYATEDKWFGVTNPEDEEIVRKQIAQYEKKYLKL